MREKPHAVLKPVPAATQAVEPDGSDALERADLAQDPDAHVGALDENPTTVYQAQPDPDEI